MFIHLHNQKVRFEEARIFPLDVLTKQTTTVKPTIFAPAMTPSLSHENNDFQLQAELFFKQGEAPIASRSLQLFNPFSQKRAGNTATIHAPKSIQTTPQNSL